jgi:hypothetical protein
MKLRLHINILTASIRTLLFCSLFQLNVQGQTITVSNAGLFYIDSGTTVVVKGNMVNKSSADLMNDGNLLLTGNLLNDESTMRTGIGTLQLSGTSLQTLSGSAPFFTFHLTTDNPSGIKLLNDLSVSGQHRFVKGVISSTDRFLIYGPQSSYTGATDQRHVNGWVRKQGTSNMIFPVGDSTVLRPITLNQLAQYSEFDAHYFRPTSNHTRVTYPLVSVNANEYWVVNKNAGTTAQVVLNWDNNRVVFPFTTLTDMRGSYYNSNSWVSQGGIVAGDVSSIGTVTMNAQESFGAFSIGIIGALLRLRYLDLRASRVAHASLLRWDTQNEFEIANHQVERSDDAVHFYPIGEVAARNQLTQSSYQYFDERPLQGTAWYRIRSEGLNGQSTLSPMVSVSEGSGGDLRIYNDVTSGRVLVRASALFAGPYHYELYAADGRLIQSGAITISTGITPVQFDRRTLPGIYMIRLRNSRINLTQQLFLN